MSDSNGKSGTFTPVTEFPVKLSLPSIYPETRDTPFTFQMRVQLVEDAEKAQREFIMLPDAEQRGDNFHKYDVTMLALLSVAEPQGFPDWPAAQNGETLVERIQAYFLPDDPERREGMRFICRRVMALYHQATQPDQYL